VLAQLECEAGGKTWLELPGLFGKYSHLANSSSTRGSRRRMDIFSMFLDGQHHAIDNTGVDAAAPSVVQSVQCLMRPLQPLIVAEDAKMKKYGDIVPGATFIPAAFGTQTELGPGARHLITQQAFAIARRKAGTVEPTPAAVANEVRYAHRRLGLAIMRAQAVHILGVAGDVVTAAIAANKPFTHPALLRQRRPATSQCRCGLAACVCHTKD
jgi:hypothetical protein